VEKVNAKTGIVKDGYSVILYLFNEDYHWLQPALYSIICYVI
jgi:hypothetical protein